MIICVLINFLCSLSTHSIIIIIALPSASKDCLVIVCCLSTLFFFLRVLQTLNRSYLFLKAMHGPRSECLCYSKFCHVLLAKQCSHLKLSFKFSGNVSIFSRPPNHEYSNCSSATDSLAYLNFLV